MQISDRTLGMSGRLEDRTAIVLKDAQPRFHVGSMIGSWLQLRHDSKIGTKQRRADFGHEFFPRAFTAILRIATEIATDSVGARGPMALMPISA